MEYAIGIGIAAAVGLFGSVIGFDKERSFYPVVLIVITSYYFLFAAMAGSMDSLAAEAFPALMFVAAASLLLPAFVAYMNQFQIKPEERALLAKFGPRFLQYLAAVRWWV